MRVRRDVERTITHKLSQKKGRNRNCSQSCFTNNLDYLLMNTKIEAALYCLVYLVQRFDVTR